MLAFKLSETPSVPRYTSNKAFKKGSESMDDIKAGSLLEEASSLIRIYEKNKKVWIIIGPTGNMGKKHRSNFFTCKVDGKTQVNEIPVFFFNFLSFKASPNACKAASPSVPAPNDPNLGFKASFKASKNCCPSTSLAKMI